MAGGKSAAGLRRKILKSRGIATTTTTKKNAPRSLDKGRVDSRKTLAMLAIEAYWNIPLEELLLDGSNREVGKRVGISKSTVSKWRKRLGLGEGNGTTGAA